MDQLRNLRDELSTIIHDEDGTRIGDVEEGDHLHLSSSAHKLARVASALSNVSNTASETGLLSSTAEDSEVDDDDAPRGSTIRRRRGLNRWSKHSVRPTVSYNFLEVQDEKYDHGLLPRKTKWWHGYFFFSVVALIACIVTLWAPYPMGARMPSDMVATMPWSSGCQDGLKTCICPRETICADNVLRMVFLTIARCSAWFDYPLYMVLFLSKCDNLVSTSREVTSYRTLYSQNYSFVRDLQNSLMQNTPFRLFMNFR